MKRNEKKSNKLRLKVLFGALALTMIGTGVCYLSIQSQNGSSKTEEVKKDTNKVQETTSSNKMEQSEKQKQTPNQQTPTNQPTPESSTSGAESVVWESEAKLLQGNVVTVTKDTQVDLFEYFVIENAEPGTRAFIIDFSDSAAVEVIQETPNGTPVSAKFKSDVVMTVVAGKNKINIQFKVK